MEIVNSGGSNIVHTKRNRKARKVSRPGQKDEKFVEYKEESYASSSGGMRISFKGAERPFGAIGNFRQKKKNQRKEKKDRHLSFRTELSGPDFTELCFLRENPVFYRIIIKITGHGTI